jgi:hypothetical protein
MQFLNLYHAELARILGLQCGNIGALAGGGWELRAGSPAWIQA